VLLVLVLPLLPPTALLGWDWWTCNLGTLVPGQIYRSGQMPGDLLARTVRAYRIKTVLNLRGPNPDKSWYRDERAAALGAGATLIDVALSSCEWMSRAQLRALVRVLDTCERPVLMHCEWGSERTGLVAAFAELLRPGATLQDAEDQFSIRYLFLRAGDGKVMAEHLDQYEAWLADRGWPHTPERFRLWVREGFQPRAPSREQWPYDPNPLVVITRPPASAPAATNTPGARALSGAGPKTDGIKR
jgi:hypothetical protein